MVSFGLVFLTLSMTIGANLSDGFISRLGFDANVLLAGLVAFVVAGLIAQRRLALIVVVVLCAVGANLPAETAARIGYDPDVLLAGMLMMVALPCILRQA